MPTLRKSHVTVSYDRHVLACKSLDCTIMATIRSTVYSPLHDRDILQVGYGLGPGFFKRTFQKHMRA